jgi:hypothetical protein
VGGGRERHRERDRERETEEAEGHTERKTEETHTHTQREREREREEAERDPQRGEGLQGADIERQRQRHTKRHTHRNTADRSVLPLPLLRLSPLRFRFLISPPLPQMMTLSHRHTVATVVSRKKEKSERDQRCDFRSSMCFSYHVIQKSFPRLCTRVGVISSEGHGGGIKEAESGEEREREREREEKRKVKGKELKKSKNFAPKLIPLLFSLPFFLSIFTTSLKFYL